MSLDGLRAWIGEVERQLGVRTRIFLVLVAIAVGGAGTAIYLALEAQNDQVSKSELQAVESALETKIAELETRSPTGTGTTALEIQVRQLQAKVEALERASGKGTKGSGSRAPGGSGEYSTKQ
ncbi:MAG: hypothetical protein ACM3N0_01445 [Chloroflexota bacterium]